MPEYGFSDGLPPACDLLLTDWFRRVRESQTAHYECGVIYGRLSRVLGVPTIGLTTFVGTKVFTTVDHAANGEWKIGLGLCSVLAAILASLQTFLNFEARADKHRLIGAKYGTLRRSMELLKTFPPSSEQALFQEIERLKKELDDLAETAPYLPSRMKSIIDKRLRRRGFSGIFVVPPTPPDGRTPAWILRLLSCLRNEKRNER